MKVSIITVVRNNAAIIKDSIDSVLGQTYKNIEYIVVDGASTDGTVEIVRSYGKKIAKLISEPDKGIYDAMNKGIRLATGDIVGFLNSDDLYADQYVVENVVNCIIENNVDSCYGDLVYVDRNNINKIVRYWQAGDYNKENFKKGWMPPHPTFFVKRKIYEKYGCFNLKFTLAADYELMLRLLFKYEISTCYIPKILVKMRSGGKSKPGLSTITGIKETYIAWKINELKYPLGVLFKPVRKISQWLRKVDTKF